MSADSSPVTEASSVRRYLAVGLPSVTFTPLDVIAVTAIDHVSDDHSAELLDGVLRGDYGDWRAQIRDDDAVIRAIDYASIAWDRHRTRDVALAVYALAHYVAGDESRTGAIARSAHNLRNSAALWLTAAARREGASFAEWVSRYAASIAEVTP